MLSTSLIALTLAAVNITKQKTILLGLLITLGECTLSSVITLRRVLPEFYKYGTGTLIRRVLYHMYMAHAVCTYNMSHADTTCHMPSGTWPMQIQYATCHMHMAHADNTPHADTINYVTCT